MIGARCPALPSRPQRWSSRKPFNSCGSRKELFYLNEIDTFSMKAGLFSVRKDAALIFITYNQHHQVDYKLTIQPSEPRSCRFKRNTVMTQKE